MVVGSTTCAIARSVPRLSSSKLTVKSKSIFLCLELHCSDKHRNPMLCRDCHQTFRRSMSSVEGIDGTPSVMWPFFGCVSFDPVMKGRCGNCTWEEHVCTWEV